jgi:hypothetical protein
MKKLSLSAAPRPRHAVAILELMEKMLTINFVVEKKTKHFSTWIDICIYGWTNGHHLPKIAK